MAQHVLFFIRLAPAAQGLCRSALFDRYHALALIIKDIWLSIAAIIVVILVLFVADKLMPCIKFLGIMHLLLLPQRLHEVSVLQKRLQPLIVEAIQHCVLLHGIVVGLRSIDAS